MDLLSVTSEIYPLVKTGGLADVAGALPAALAAHKVAVRTLIPGYPSVMAQMREPQIVAEYGDLFDGSARILAGRVLGLDLFVIDAPHLYNREGGPYGGAGGDYADNWKRYAALSYVAAELTRGLSRATGPTSCRPMTGSRRWRRPMSPSGPARRPSRRS